MVFDKTISKQVECCMRHRLLAGFVGITAVLWGQTAAPQKPAAAKPAVGGLPATRATLDQYCVTCHNQKAKVAGLQLDKMDLAHVAESAETWEKVVRKLRAGMMPPVGAKRPDPATYESLRVSLENELDRAAATKPAIVAPGIHRVNRTEYANAIHDLLGLDIDPAEYLPVDDSSYGFDNIAASLSVSPALVSGYMSAAGKISRLALGMATSPTQKKFSVPADRSGESQVDGLPLGTRGGMLIKYFFPADGEYMISWIPVRGVHGELYGNLKGEKLEVRLDGARVKLFDVDKLPATTNNDKNEVRLTVKAGLRRVGVTFLATTQVPGDDLNQHSLRSVIEPTILAGYHFAQELGQVVIAGPYNGTRSKDLETRRRILACEPASDTEEISCAKKIISNLAREAFRRPLAPTDVEVLLSDYQQGRNHGDFESGIQRVLQAVLADPEFIYRLEGAPENAKSGQPYRISDPELASRLAFFLWSSPPDEELLGLASEGKLKNPVVLEQQTKRMLADSRSHALAANFAGQWLQLRNLPSSVPIMLDFPDFDDNLRLSFKTETEMLFESIMREDRSVVTLLDADYTFVNERLARHYGIPNVYGNEFRRIKLDGALDVRRGLLGQGSIELVTSLANRTSPVQRGKWVLMNILGIIPPDPPPNVPALKESESGVVVETSMRQRMESHRANAVCASCHKMFDPIGFSLENFDAVGKYRTAEFDQLIDVSGQLVDGTKFTGPVGLRAALLKYSPQFVQVATEKLMTYALGRGVEYYDMPTVRAIDREADRNNDRFSALVLGIVKSGPFQTNVKPAEAVARK
jgi:mono/diheme cytochrome c family protein